MNLKVTYNRITSETLVNQYWGQERGASGRDFPEEIRSSLAGQCFWLRHIDVDIYQSAKDFLDWVWSCLVSARVVIFDDYGFVSCPGISRFIKEEAQLANRLLLYNLKSHAFFVKIR